MQFYIRTKDEGTGTIGTSSAKSNTAASVFVTCINCCLNCRCVVVNAVTDSTVIVYVINHNYSHLYNIWFCILYVAIGRSGIGT